MTFPSFPSSCSLKSRDLIKNQRRREEEEKGGKEVTHKVVPPSSSLGVPVTGGHNSSSLRIGKKLI